MNYPAFVLVILVAAFAFMTVNMTGFLVAGDKEFTKTWDFSNSSEYIYNTSLIDLSSGARLKANTTTTQYTNTEVTQYSVEKVLYDPSDKTNKVNSLDDSKHELKENRIFDIVFPSGLINGDVISFYLKKGKASNFHLCDVSEFCNFLGYGNASYVGEEDGWINITLSGLTEYVKIFSINTDDDIKIDYITSTSEIAGAYYDPADKTAKINAQDGEIIDVEKKKLLNIFFNGSLDDDYVVSFYLKGDEDSEIILCDIYLCSEEYALISYPGEEGWYNATLVLASPITHFSINVSDEIKVDYIYAAYYNKTSYNVTNTTYPKSATIETQDFFVQNLKSWGEFSKSESLNNQNISYQYSTDSGLTWTDVGDLESIESKKIMMRFILTSNTTDTPVLDSFSLDYIASLPVFGENRNTKASPGDTVNITLNITNPNLVSSAVAYIKYTNGTVLNSVPLSYNNKTLLFEGYWNSISSGLYYIDAEIESNYTEKMSQKQLLSLISSTKGSLINSSIHLTKNQTLTINSKDTTNTILDIIPLDNVNNVTLSIVEYVDNLKADNPKTALGKYIDIVVDEKLKSNLSKATMTIYYSDSDIQGSGVDEASLKIHYFNDTSNQWEVLDSFVNTTGNYVTAMTTHFSTYGIFGDSVQSGSGGSGSSSSSGGESGGRRKPVSELIPIETASFDSSGVKEDESECVSVVSIYLEGSKVFIKNSGSCVLENVLLRASSHILKIIKIPERIESIQPGEKESIDLGQNNNLVILSPVTGLAVLSSEIYGGEILITFIENGVEKEKRLSVNVKINKTEHSDIILILVTIVLVASFYFLAKKSVKPYRKNKI